MRSSVVASAIALSVLVTAVRPALAKPDEPPASSAEREAREKSRAAFRTGVAQLRAQDWKGARASFEQAWALYPHPSILLNLGIARLRTDDPVLAEQDFVRFLSEDFGATQEELAGAREALAETRTKIGTIRVVASPASARIVVDGKSINERVRSEAEGVIAEVRAKAGRHTVAVDAEGHGREERTVDLAARAELEVKFALAPTAATSNPPPPNGTSNDGPTTRTIGGYGLAALAGVGLVTGAVCGLRAISLSSDYEDRGKVDTFQNPDVKSEGETFRTAADVAFGVAIVSGVAAAILLFTDVGASSGNGVARRSPALFRW